MPHRRSGKIRLGGRGASVALLATFAGVLAASLSCKSTDAGRAESARVEIAPSRGDRVVVEETAAVFFEGRVLALEGDRLRVQTSDGGNSISVAQSDVYRLPPGLRSEHRVGSFAICAKVPAQWTPCRVERVDGASVSLSDVQGALFSLSVDRVLLPTPVTELNLRRHFERTRERSEFLRAVERAGAPRRPPGWRPALRERVLARHDSGWFSARVNEFEDDDVHVVWQSDKRVSKLDVNQIVPEPPYTARARRGEFVLLRPELLSQAWKPVRIAAVNEGELDVLDVNGERRSVSVRDVVPLVTR